MDALRFNIFVIKDLNNGKIIYLNDEYCKELARSDKWDYKSITKTDLDRCNKKIQPIEYVKSGDGIPRAALFLPFVGPFWMSPGKNGFTYSDHWRTDLSPKILAVSKDNLLMMCAFNKDRNKKGNKTCSTAVVSSDRFFSFKADMPKIAYINQEIGAYDFGTQSYENALKEMTEIGFPEGKKALDKIKSGKSLCDGEILRKVTIDITIEYKVKSNFLLQGAYYLCPSA